MFKISLSVGLTDINIFRIQGIFFLVIINRGEDFLIISGERF